MVKKLEYQDLLDHFGRLHPREVDLNLTRIARVLADLGAPQLRLPPTIHVAGTNGKGSTISCLRSIYQAAGFRVHVYTSPHLIDYNERIRLAGTLITDTQLTQYLSCVHQANGAENLTIFEALTAAAFLAFSQIPADVLLLETGLGGRLDATNMLDQPLACVLTPISLDHQDFLGDTLGEIAWEKAGIIKKNSPVFIGKQTPEVVQILLNKAHEMGATVYLNDRDWQLTTLSESEKIQNIEGRQSHDQGTFQLKFEKKTYPLPRPRLVGNHQIQNAALAAAVVLGLREKLAVDDLAMAQGLKIVEWPGRLECLTTGALCNPGVEIWLDGAHNEQGFQALRDFIDSQQQHYPKKIVMGVAMLKNRDPQLFFQTFNPVAEQYILIDMQENERFHAPDSLAKYTQTPCQQGTINELNKIFQKKCLFGSRIFISGSLYLVGKVLDHDRYEPNADCLRRIS